MFCNPRKIPILGKHTKRITCGAWSKQNLLALGGEDKVLTINNADGDTLRQTSLRADPAEIHFSEMKMDERSANGENTVQGAWAIHSIISVLFDLYYQSKYAKFDNSIWILNFFVNRILSWKSRVFNTFKCFWKRKLIEDFVNIHVILFDWFYLGEI